MNYTKLKQLMKYFLLACIIAWIISMIGCSTAKKDFSNVNKAIMQHPAQTAKQLNDWRPCIPLVTVNDSSDYKKYLEDLHNLTDYYNHLIPDTVTDTFMEIWTDTSKIKFYKNKLEASEKQMKYLNSYIHDLTQLCKDKPPVHDTIKIEDSRKLLIIASQLETSVSDTKKIQAQADKKQIWINWLLIIAIVFGSYIGLTIYKKFLIPKL